MCAILNVMKYLFVILALSSVMSGCRYVDDASDTTYNEFKASSLLTKYTRFKDMYASLDSKRATIKLLQGKIKGLQTDYKDVPRNQWARDDRQAVNQWNGETDGLKASYNDLAATYNADMSKFNVDFTNIGKLPEGASDPLPRNVAPYIED